MSGIERIQRALSIPRERRVVIYLTAGYPTLESTTELCREVERSGAAMIEIGIPFSDPVADGPVIQRASEVALKNGVSLGYILELVRSLRSVVSIPILLMGHLNPILRFGERGFYRQASDAGVDGLIIPDLPLEEFAGERAKQFGDFGLASVMLITEKTPVARVRLADSLASGFLYAVSRPGVTGGGVKLDSTRVNYLEGLQRLKLRNKILVGFGVETKEDVDELNRYADGAIIGSAFISALSQELDPVNGAVEFMESVLGV